MPMVPDYRSADLPAYSEAGIRYEERELALVRWCKKVQGTGRANLSEQKKASTEQLSSAQKTHDAGDSN